MPKGSEFVSKIHSVSTLCQVAVRYPAFDLDIPKLLGIGFINGYDGTYMQATWWTNSMFEKVWVQAEISITRWTVGIKPEARIRLFQT